MFFKKKKVHKTPTCLNCGYIFQSEEHNNFCPSCGQKNQKLLTLKETLEEFVGSIFSYDSKVYQSLLPFIFKPGKLTKEFIRGRRTHYIHPIRLYLVISLLYFTIASPLVIDFPEANTKVSEMSNSHKRETQIAAYEDSLLINYKNPSAEKFYQKAQSLKDSLKKQKAKILAKAKNKTTSLFNRTEKEVGLSDIVTYQSFLSQKQIDTSKDVNITIGTDDDEDDEDFDAIDSSKKIKNEKTKNEKTKTKKVKKPKKVNLPLEKQIMDSLNIEKSFINTLMVRQTLRFSDSTIGQISLYFVNKYQYTNSLYY
jgi:predicted  nucleic acid-binding Zn-ribbon protein